MTEPFDHERAEVSVADQADDALPYERPPVVRSRTHGHVRRGLRHQRVRRRRRTLLAVVGVILALIVAFVAWYEVQVHPVGSQGSQVILTVHKGESTSTVTDALASDGVVGSSLALKLYFFLHGSPRLEPGGYVLHKNSSFSAVKGILDQSPNLATVTVQPGLTLAEVAKQLPPGVQTQFQTALRGGAVSSPFEPPGSTSLEGLLGAGTYDVLPGETGSQLLVQMVRRFEGQAAQVGLTPAAAQALGVTPYQVVTIASIVQKEGYLQKNMGPVARVIYNRLARAMPLQMDATILFSLGQDGGTVTPQELREDTPYNTYLHAGLTPTPICFPSAAALRAALAPPPGSWLYFQLVDKDGTEAFATTFQQQLANEQLAKSRGIG